MKMTLSKAISEGLYQCPKCLSYHDRFGGVFKIDSNIEVALRLRGDVPKRVCVSCTCNLGKAFLGALCNRGK